MSAAAAAADSDPARPRRADRAGTAPPAPEPLPLAVADAHCHLDLLDVRPEEAAAAAAAVGVPTLITVGVDLETSRWQARVAAELDGVWAAVAVHPNDVGPGVDEAVLAEIARLADLPQVRAVGETGLDHYRTPAEGHRAQEESFRRHIEIARSARRPLMVHDRDAHDDVLRVLTTAGAPDVVVVHCFSGDAAFARVCADHGWYCSFAGNVTFRNAGALREAARVVPQDLLLVETDSPFLTPDPYRGRPNGPYLVPLTVRALALARDEDLDELCAAVRTNADRVFGPL